MQQMLPFLKYPPLHNNFLSYLKTKDLSNSEIEKIIHSLKYQAGEINNEAILYAITFALETTQHIIGDVKREERKRECYYHYKNLEDSKMKRAEKVKYIAKKMHVNPDCIQVYLRELFPSKN